MTDELPDANYPTRRMGDQGYRLTIETTDHIGSTTFAGHDHHRAEVSIGLDDTPELVEQLDTILDQIREENMVGQYGCRECDTPFRMKKTPKMCPYCGNEDIEEFETWLQS